MITILVIIAGVVVWWLLSTQRSNRKRVENISQALKSINATHGTSFSVTDPALIMRDAKMIGHGEPTVWMFDPHAKKICIFRDGGRSSEVIDFSYIRSWKLEWDEGGSGNASARDNIRFVFDTVDLERPILQLHLGRLWSTAEAWRSRLRLLLGDAST